MKRSNRNSARRLAATVMAAACLAAMSATALELIEDKPSVAAPGSGTITGFIIPPDKVAKLFAVSRATGKSYLPAAFDRKTGKFAFEKMPGDASYDICFDTADGRRIEGIDLEFVDARLLRLADVRRKQLGLAAEPEHKFSPSDVKELLAFVRDLKDFMEIRRVLYVRGHGARATILVELLRTRSFHASTGEVIWRIELWYFENQFGGWERLANQERVLRRERISPGQWRKIDVTYYPQLSAYVAPDGRSDAIRFQVPGGSEPARGRPANTAPHLETAPEILGLDVRGPQPATGPAADRTQPAERDDQSDLLD
jgi:hypothetical protein